MFKSPYGYQTYSAYSTTPTPWGWNTTFTGGTFVRPYVTGPTHSIYRDPFLNNYQYTYPIGPITTGVSVTPARRIR